jgi:CubicO group peptidase (beta-lactamase class C family)
MYKQGLIYAKKSLRWIRVAMSWLFLLAAHTIAAQPDFASLDRTIRGWVDGGYYSGASLIVARISPGAAGGAGRTGAAGGDKPIYEKYFGNYTPATVAYIASAGKWLAAATIAAVVDQGLLSWDDKVKKWLPAFTGPKGEATLRQLLSHTAGYPDYQPRGRHPDDYSTLQESVAHIVDLPADTTPGAVFHYGGLAMQVAGRMTELATGKDWETVFREKIAGPLDMPATHFTPVDTTQGHNPMLGGGARTTLHDYFHFLEMIAHDGRYKGKRILSFMTIREMQTDQVRSARVAPGGGEYVARARGRMAPDIYGLGEWREEVNENGEATLISSPSWAGAYPWIDKKNKVYGFFLARVNVDKANAGHFSAFYSSPVLPMLVRGGVMTAHPFLFFTPTAIRDLKERVRTDTAAANNWQRIRSKADSAVSAGKGGDMESLCLAYRMTGDTKYAQRAKELLVQLVNSPAWDGMDDRTPRWNSGLATGKSCFTSSLGFDCLYDFLTAEERKEVAAKIVRLGIQPSIGDWISPDKRLHSLNSMGHNWWSAVVHEAGVASLAVMNEIPAARGWAEEVMRSSKEWWAFSGSVLDNKPASFDEDGGFYESIGYASFALSEYLLFRLAWTNALSPITMPYDSLLVKTMDWFIHGCYPNAGPIQSLNFGDSNPFGNAQKPVSLMIALGFKKESYTWYLQQMEAGGSKGEFGKSSPLGLVYAPARATAANGVSAGPEKAPGLPLSALYKDMGWATLRSSWDTNATLLGVKSGFTWNHAHADAGSFVLYHKGKNLLIDGGDAFYGSDEYSSYFVRSEAHNVMLFNGKAQDPQDQYHAVKNPGHLYNLMDGGDIKYVLADAQGPTAHYFLRNYRSFLWIGKVILVIDDVKAYEPGKFEWLMHFDQDARRKGPDFEITNGNAAVLVRPLFPETLPMGYPHDFPEKMVVEERWGYKDHDVKTRIPYYAISPPEPASVQKFINAIILLDEDNKPVTTFTGSSGASGSAGRSNLPSIEKLEGKDMIGVRIRQDGKVTDVYFNLLADGRLMHRNSNNIFNGWETDAYMMAVTYADKSGGGDPDQVTEYFISNGSYLRKDDRIILHSLSKVFMIAKTSGAVPEVILQGQPVMHVDLLLKDKGSSLLLNGQRVKPLYGGDHKTLVIDISEKTPANE